MRRLPVALGLVVLVVVAAAIVLVVRASDDGASASSSSASSSSRARAPKALASRTDLRPPTPTIRRSRPGQAPGLIFVAPKKVFGARKVPGEQDGPLIMDEEGRVRWFLPTRDNQDVYDFRTQTYRGEPVLTYWEGRATSGTGRGECVIRDTAYKLVARVEFRGPDDADIHECQLTPRDSMLMMSYETVAGDERPAGGPRDGRITEGVVKEIDVQSNRVLFEWRSLDHVPITESYEPLEGHSGPGYDYIHLNSVQLDDDGDYIVSARHTWAVYKIDKDTGDVVWRLGGKKSDFPLGGDVRMSWQHDAIPVGDGQYRIFDNAAGTQEAAKTDPNSRVVWIEVDPEDKTARVVRQIEHPSGLSAGTQGNSQELPGGRTFVGWGSQGVFSEFDSRGRMLFDARVPRGYDTYRAYRDPWTGDPATRPAVSARRSGRSTQVDVSWNGATEVARWQVLAGSSPRALEPVGAPARWDGLDTRVRSRTQAPFVAVRALDADGGTLRTSAPERVQAAS